MCFLIVNYSIIFQRSCLISHLTYISVWWRLSGISAIRHSIGWFHKHWKWRVGKQEKIPFFIEWTWYAWKNKGHTIVLQVFYEILLRSYIKFLGYCFLKCFWYWNNKQLRVKQNILWIKWITLQMWTGL